MNKIKGLFENAGPHLISSKDKDAYRMQLVAEDGTDLTKRYNIAYLNLKTGYCMVADMDGRIFTGKYIEMNFAGATIKYKDDGR